MGGPPVPEHILDAARRHLNTVPPVPGTRWVIRTPRRVSGGWFFVYRIERHPPSREPPPQFGYFPGYLVSDDGTVRNIGEQAFRELVESGSVS
jgi:hypothetical protein